MTQREALAEWMISHCHKTCGREMNVEKETALMEADEILKVISESKRVIKRKSKETDPAVTDIIKHYYDQFVFLYSDPPQIKGGAAGSMIKKLLLIQEPERIKSAINDYLVADDEFFKKTGYSLLLLPNFLQKQAVQLKQKPKWDGFR